MMTFLNPEDYCPSLADLYAWVFAPNSLTTEGFAILTILIETNPEISQLVHELRQRGRDKSLQEGFNNSLNYRPLSKAYALKETKQPILRGQIWTVKDFVPNQSKPDEYYLRPSKAQAPDRYEPLLVYINSKMLYEAVVSKTNSLQLKKVVEVFPLVDVCIFTVGCLCARFRYKYNLGKKYWIIYRRGYEVDVAYLHRLMYVVNKHTLEEAFVIPGTPDTKVDPENRSRYLSQQFDYMAKSLIGFEFHSFADSDF